jgi:hypothetical protein
MGTTLTKIKIKTTFVEIKKYMEIKATITKILYTVKLAKQLQKIELTDFNINNAPTACLITDGNSSFAISKWVSPKRTRSYPYERIYNTLNISKKITVIPIVKDEGAAGDRDYIQWDTVSLMSLLDVFVIFAYYNKADKAGHKITNQQFDNDYVLEQINTISTFHSSALHWNLDQLKEQFNDLLKKVKTNYTNIEIETGVKLHGLDGIDKFREKINKDVAIFMTFSRQKAKDAQAREFVTLQPKEALTTATKAKITITNYLGGQYFFTVDEVKIQGNNLYLIEGKHTKRGLLPSKSDIKDGLLKMILYSNLSDTFIENSYQTLPVLELTSTKIKGTIDSNDTVMKVEKFINDNTFSDSQINFINRLLSEAKINNFTVRIKKMI